MDPSSYDEEELEKALERRGWGHIDTWNKSEEELRTLLREAILAQKAQREVEQRRLSALPCSPLRRRPLPYELIALIQSFVVGPRAILTHVALSRLSLSVRTYLFGQSEEVIEERWKQHCLHSGLGQLRKDITDPASPRLSWKETAYELVEEKNGSYGSSLCASWLQRETLPRWRKWNRLLLASAGSDIKVLTSHEVEDEVIALLVNPALSTMRLRDFNEVDIAFKSPRDGWYSAYDFSEHTSLLLTWPPVSSLTLEMTDVAGNRHDLHLQREEGVVIWDIFEAWWDEMWFPVEHDLLADFVEGYRGDYSSSIPVNQNESLYTVVDTDEEDELADSDDDEDGPTWATLKEAALEKIDSDYAGDFGLMYGRILFGGKAWYGQIAGPVRGCTTFELLFEDDDH